MGMTEAGKLLLQDRDWRRRNSMWLLPTLVCCGVLTWASFLYVGVRAKRPAWLAAAAAYGVATATYFVLVDTAPRAADGTSITPGGQSTFGTIFFLAVWIGGSIHALIINSQWLSFLASPKGLTPTSWSAASTEIMPETLSYPWRSFVSHAQTLQREIVAAVDNTPPGPMRDRLKVLADHIDTGMTECWQLAQEGQRLDQARARIDTATATRGLTRVQALEADPSLTQAAQAFQAQLDTAMRIEGAVASTYNGLDLLNARLGEVEARVIELSVRPHALNDVAAIESVVESVVNELISIREAHIEMDR